jgi:hypothetical protein
MLLGKLDICMQKTGTRFIFHLYKYQLIVDQGLRPETLKLVQERARNTLEFIGIVHNFLKRTQWLSN